MASLPQAKFSFTLLHPTDPVRVQTGRLSADSETTKVLKLNTRALISRINTQSTQTSARVIFQPALRNANVKSAE